MAAHAQTRLGLTIHAASSRGQRGPAGWAPPAISEEATWRRAAGRRYHPEQAQGRTSRGCLPSSTLVQRLAEVPSLQGGVRPPWLPLPPPSPPAAHGAGCSSLKSLGAARLVLLPLRLWLQTRAAAGAAGRGSLGPCVSAAERGARQQLAMFPCRR